MNTNHTYYAANSDWSRCFLRENYLWLGRLRSLFMAMTPIHGVGPVTLKIMNTKKCSKCGEVKGLSKFHGNSQSKDGKRPECAMCRKDYVEASKDRIRSTRKRWYLKNRDIVLAKAKEYRDANRDKINASTKKRRDSDPQFKLSLALRSRLNHAIKGVGAKGSGVRDLGCTVPELRKYLESKFAQGMSWDNWAIDGWHIDHIRPLASFDLTDRGQLIEACHYTNLQPLWAKENFSKGGRYSAAPEDTKTNNQNEKPTDK